MKIPVLMSVPVLWEFCGFHERPGSVVSGVDEGRVLLLILAGEDLIQSLDDWRKVLLDGVPEDR
jgi:hypothetical protein